MMSSQSGTFPTLMLIHLMKQQRLTLFFAGASTPLHWDPLHEQCAQSSELASRVEFRTKTTCASGSLDCHNAITTQSCASASAAESVQVSKALLLWFSNIEQSVRGRFHCCNTSQKPYTPGLCIACTSWRQCYPRIQLLVQIACKPPQHLTRSLVHGLVCHHCIVPVTTLR